MIIPEGYTHKATSDSFNGTESVVIYHCAAVDRYLLVMTSSVNEDADDAHVYITKTQLELIVQSANDALEMR